MAVTFLLLTLLVQVATAMTARSAADAAVSAAAHRAALPGASAAAEEASLQETLERIVPGAVWVRPRIDIRVRRVTAVARIRWRPPGPVFSPITIVVRSEVPLATPP